MTTDHEGDEVFERLRAEYQALVEELGDSLDIDAGLADALKGTHVDSSPDPEGAVAREVAPESEAAQEARWRPEPGVAPPGYRFVFVPFEDGRGGVWTLEPEAAPDSDTAQDATTATPIDLGPAVQVGKRWPPARQATDREWPYNSDTAGGAR